MEAPPRYIFLSRPYTPRKNNPPYKLSTPLSSLKGIGPLFSQRLTEQGFTTVRDLVKYYLLSATTKKAATRKFREICRNPRAKTCLGNETRRINRYGRRVGNRYKVREINQLAYDTLVKTPKAHFLKQKTARNLRALTKIPASILPRIRPTLKAYPKSCPPT